MSEKVDERAPGIGHRMEEVEITRTVSSGVLKGVRRFESPDELPDGARSVLLSILYVQGASELASARQFAPWLQAAPTVEDRFVVARIIADEVRHGLEFCRLLQAFGVDGSRLTSRLELVPPPHTGLAAFDDEIGTWPELAAFLCFVDRVGLLHRRNFTDCCYGPLARSMPTMIHEERSHVGYGAALLRRMLRGGSTSGEAAEAATRRWLGIATGMFGASSGTTDDHAHEIGLAGESTSVLRDRFLEDVDPVVRSLGFGSVSDLVAV